MHNTVSFPCICQLWLLRSWWEPSDSGWNGNSSIVLISISLMIEYWILKFAICAPFGKCLVGWFVHLFVVLFLLWLNVMTIFWRFFFRVKKKYRGQQAVNVTSCREDGVGERRARSPFEPSQHGGQPYGKQADTWQAGNMGMRIIWVYQRKCAQDQEGKNKKKKAWMSGNSTATALLSFEKTFLWHSGEDFSPILWAVSLLSCFFYSEEGFLKRITSLEWQMPILAWFPGIWSSQKVISS